MVEVETMLQIKGKTVNRVVMIDVESIQPNPAQPRTQFKQSEIEGLAASIVLNGLLQPLTVRKVENGFELISGERRLRALKFAQLQQAPCIIMETTDKQSAVFALLENIQRSDLNYFEEAEALKNLMVEWNISQQELGTRLGKAQSTIANKLRLLKFSKEEQMLMLEKGINERQARALIKIQKPELLQEALNNISEKGLNVSQTEKYIDSLLDEQLSLNMPKKKFHPIIKDVRLFVNTINNAIKVMNESGVGASTEKIEHGDFIEYIVKIPIQASASNS